MSFLVINISSLIQLECDLMKHKKTFRYILIISIFTVFIITNALVNSSLNEEQISLEKEGLKSNAYWNLTGSPIFVDDNDGSRNWAYHESNFDWCTGSGTELDPYVIENVRIDALGGEYGIKITDSSEYFIVRNCTVYNSGGVWGPDGAFVLLNVKNGIITNNTSYNNEWIGIKTLWLEDCLISENRISKSYYGIEFSGDNSKVAKNIVKNCIWGGIGCDQHMVNSIITNNLVVNNTREGIDLSSYVSNLTCSNNYISNSGDGIQIYTTYNSSSGLYRGHNIINNVIERCGRGIYLESNANNNNFTKNKIYDNEYGIYSPSFATTQNNLMYSNYFLNNEINAQLSNGNNYWNNSITGNYWYDYVGVDVNLDGIGDVPYDFDDDTDFKPIFSNNLVLSNNELLISMNSSILESPTGALFSRVTTINQYRFDTPITLEPDLDDEGDFFASSSGQDRTESYDAYDITVSTDLDYGTASSYCISTLRETASNQVQWNTSIILPPGYESYFLVHIDIKNIDSNQILIDEIPSHIHDGINILNSFRGLLGTGFFPDSLRNDRLFIYGQGEIPFKGTTGWNDYSASASKPFYTLYDDSTGEAVTVGYLDGSTDANQIIPLYRLSSISPIRGYVDFTVEEASISPGGMISYNFFVAIHNINSESGEMVYNDVKSEYRRYIPAPPEDAIPGYDLILIFSIISLVSIVIIRNQKWKKRIFRNI
jgi:parallel beta-helix repeat protein